MYINDTIQIIDESDRQISMTNDEKSLIKKNDKSHNKIDQVITNLVEKNQEELDSCHNQQSVLIFLMSSIKAEIAKGAMLKTIYSVLKEKELINYSSYQTFLITMNRLGIKSREIKKDSRKHFKVDPKPKEPKSNNDHPVITEQEKDITAEEQPTIAGLKNFSVDAFAADTEDILKAAQLEAKREEQEKRSLRKNNQSKKGNT